jgi:penicillin-binding protein 1A
MMQDVVSRGTGKRADGLGRPTAGKTGTTNGFHDNWFVGYTPELLTAVWIGFDSKRSLGSRETGGRNAAPIWKAFMEKATANLPMTEFPIPDGLRCINVDPATGRRAAPGGASRLECFRVDRDPVPAAPAQTEPVVAQAEQPRESVRDFLRNDF